MCSVVYEPLWDGGKAEMAGKDGNERSDNAFPASRKYKIPLRQGRLNNENS